jgi:hypothetical protein
VKPENKQVSQKWPHHQQHTEPSLATSKPPLRVPPPTSNTTPANDHNTSSNQHLAFLHQATTDGKTNTVPHHRQHVHGWKTIDFSSINI